MRPIHTACNMVEPSKQCQLVLRHFFNDSGVYCINVSLANDVSLAATTAKISVDMGTHTYTHKSTQHYVTVFFFSTSVNLCRWQCGLCCRFWAVLSRLYRHSVWCSGTGASCGHSGLHLQVGTLFHLSLWPLCYMFADTPLEINVWFCLKIWEKGAFQLVSVTI